MAIIRNHFSKYNFNIVLELWLANNLGEIGKEIKIGTDTNGLFIEAVF